MVDLQSPGCPYEDIELDSTKRPLRRQWLAFQMYDGSIQIRDDHAVMYVTGIRLKMHTYDGKLEDVVYKVEPFYIRLTSKSFKHASKKKKL